MDWWSYHHVKYHSALIHWRKQRHMHLSTNYFAMPLWFVMVGHNGMCKSAFVSNIHQVYSLRLKYFLATSWTFITFWRVAENGENIMEQIMAPIIQGDIFWGFVHARYQLLVFSALIHVIWRHIIVRSDFILKYLQHTAHIIYSWHGPMMIITNDL